MLLEAFAAGVPVIASDSGEIPHVVADAGRIVPEGPTRSPGSTPSASSSNRPICGPSTQDAAASGRSRSSPGR